MKVELLYVADCPHRETTRCRIKKILREFGLSEEIHETEVSNSSQARRLRFPGSPTIRIDKKDLEAPLPRQKNYGLACRTYMIGGKSQGAPTQGMIREAILSMVSNSEAKAR